MAATEGMNDKVRLFFEALSDQNRVRIIDVLLESESNVRKICAHFSMKQPSVSHHLAVLKKGGLVKTRKSGTKIFYSVNKKYVTSIMTYYFARFGFQVKEIEE
ncbi:MAG: winged helix-turn-helix transcriptional regulator [Nitrospinae bacterium]|nr:winged helix-turn-helix transcriptional regulator [Nitrospinota bacterium]